MEARHLLKQLRDDDWYLGDTEGACRQYIHPEKSGIITVCVRFSDELGPETLARVAAVAGFDDAGGSQGAAEESGPTPSEDVPIEIETTRTGASAFVAGLPGCVATGADEADVRERMAVALELHRRGLKESGS